MLWQRWQFLPRSRWPVSPCLPSAQAGAAVTTELIVEQLQSQSCESRHEATGSVFVRSSVYVRRAAFFQVPWQWLHSCGTWRKSSLSPHICAELDQQQGGSEGAMFSKCNGLDWHLISAHKHCEIGFSRSLLICHSCLFAVRGTGKQGASQREAFDARNILKVGWSSVPQIAQLGRVKLRLLN